MKRRTLLQAGIAGGALLAIGGIALVAGRDAERDRATVVRAVVPAILDGALPDGGDARLAAIDRCTHSVGVAVSQLAPSAQQELAQLFALLASAPGRIALARVDTPWERAGTTEVAAFLEAWRNHRIMLFRTGYVALHKLVLGSWYADEASWAAIGYDGPLPL